VLSDRDSTNGIHGDAYQIALQLMKLVLKSTHLKHLPSSSLHLSQHPFLKHTTSCSLLDFPMSSKEFEAEAKEMFQMVQVLIERIEM
jgi:hypothetical protein